MPIERPDGKIPAFMKFDSVEESVMTRVQIKACERMTRIEVLLSPKADSKVFRKPYSGGNDGSQDMPIVLENGGHGWPGLSSFRIDRGNNAPSFSGKDLILEFFGKYRL